MLKVFIADKLSENAVTSLESSGCQVQMNPDLNADDLPGVIADAEVLVVRSTKVTKATIDAAKNLSLIIRAGAGVNTIDLKEACARGIHVANCPGKNTDAVAELAIGHLIASDRQIVNACMDLRNGQWEKKKYQKSEGLKDRTLAVIGLGSIGKAVARKAMGLEMNVVAYSRSLTEEKAQGLGIGYCKTAVEAVKQADAVSVHMAAKPETKHFVNDELFSNMKDGAIFINTSRGEVVDTQALKEAVKEKHIRASLDVFENEPTAGKDTFKDKELADLATCTPHIGASTNQAAEAIAQEVVRIVSTYQESGKPVNTVNMRQKTSAVINLVVRHFNRVGVLAAVLDDLKNEGVNIEEMENLIFEGGKAASCTLKLDSKPSSETITKIQQSPDVVQVMLK